MEDVAEKTTTFSPVSTVQVPDPDPDDYKNNSTEDNFFVWFKKKFGKHPIYYNQTPPQPKTGNSEQSTV